jgi:tRNA (guanine10-N2)-dimethyltransferase
MLPPKLARMMVNMVAGSTETESNRPRTLLDPFCGTGVVLQEASLLGYDVIGTDLSAKMIDYSRINLDWLGQKHGLSNNVTILEGDAMTYTWPRTIDAIACETYLGQPFSAPPSPAKLEEVVGNCNHIISTFLRNIASQLDSGTPLCVAVPAWRDSAGRFTHLPLIDQLSALGYTRVALKNTRDEQLLYYRENQVVARELLLLKKA